jgi:hypothetical protein
VKTFILAAASLALALPAAAGAAQSWQDLSEQTALGAMDFAPLATSGVTVRAFPMAIQPSQEAKATTFFTNFVASGIAQSGLPCFNCVSGIPSALGLPDPYNYVPSNTVMQYNVAWTNLTYKGSCTVSIAITAGKKVIDSASFNVTGINGAGGYDIGLNRPRPTYSGQAVLTGKVKCGVPTSMVHAPLMFQ